MIDLSVHIERMKAHIEADELVRGLGFEDGKGCFIGCTFDRYDHRHAAKTTGVPEWLWYLADELHESMSRSVDRGDMALKLLRGFEKCEDFDALERAIHIYIQRQNIERVKALEIDDALAWSAKWSAAEAAAKAAGWSAALAASSAAEAEDWSALAHWSARCSAAEAAAYDDIGQELLRLLGVYGLALSEAVEAGE